jgi:hypothetical protein
MIALRASSGLMRNFPPSGDLSLATSRGGFCNGFLLHGAPGATLGSSDIAPGWALSNLGASLYNSGAFAGALSNSGAGLEQELVATVDAASSRIMVGTHNDWRSQSAAADMLLRSAIPVMRARIVVPFVARKIRRRSPAFSDAHKAGLAIRVVVERSTRIRMDSTAKRNARMAPTFWQRRKTKWAVGQNRRR